MNARAVFLLINILGGTAVLGSYAWGFTVHRASVGQLWGEVPATLLPLYNVSMLVAAVGYLMSFAFILVRSDSLRAAMPTINWLYAVILFCSALWMPMSFAMVAAPDLSLWWCIRAVLFAVGAGAVTVWWQIYRACWNGGGWFARLALTGHTAFVFQTAVLDALVWPAYFPV